MRPNTKLYFRLDFEFLTIVRFLNYRIKRCHIKLCVGHIEIGNNKKKNNVGTVTDLKYDIVS